MYFYFSKIYYRNLRSKFLSTGKMFVKIKIQKCVGISVGKFVFLDSSNKIAAYIEDNLLLC